MLFQTAFLEWVTLTKYFWIILGERRRLRNFDVTLLPPLAHAAYFVYALYCLGSAFEAARTIPASVEARAFTAERLRVRIRIDTGPVVGSNVGGGGRQSATQSMGTR